MATIGNVALTYADWAKRLDDGYKVARIIELLSQTNEILEDMMVVLAPAQSRCAECKKHHGSDCGYVR
jgi:hypothetical protein